MNLLRPTLLTLTCLLATPGMASDLPSLGDASSAIVSPQQEHQLGRAWLSDGRNVLTGEATEVDDTTTVGPRQALIVEFKRK